MQARVVPRLLEEKLGLAVRRPSGPAKERALTELGRRLDVSDAESASLSTALGATRNGAEEATTTSQGNTGNAVLRPLQTEPERRPLAATPTAARKRKYVPVDRQTPRTLITKQMSNLSTSANKTKARLDKLLQSGDSAGSKALRDRLAKKEDELARLRREREKLPQRVRDPPNAASTAVRTFPAKRAGTSDIAVAGASEDKPGVRDKGGNTEQPPWKLKRGESPERPSAVTSPPPAQFRGDGARLACLADHARRRLSEEQGASSAHGTRMNRILAPASLVPVDWARSGLPRDVIQRLVQDDMAAFTGAVSDESSEDPPCGLRKEFVPSQLCVETETPDKLKVSVKSEMVDDNKPSFL